MSEDCPLKETDIRRLALRRPGAVEMDHHGFPSFRAAGRIFCTVRVEPRRLMVKLNAEDQHNLCEAYPGVIAPVPGYWGRKGSTYVDYGRISENLADRLIAMAFANVAPRSRRAG